MPGHGPGLDVEGFGYISAHSVGSSREPGAKVAKRSGTEQAQRALAASTAPSPDLADAEGCAELVGLRYVSDAEPGIARRRAGRGFTYLDPDGQRVTDDRHLNRIRALVVPPAWTDVWICRRADGHLQATGRDARGRKQYRYHQSWRQVRDQAKYSKMVEFGAALPKIRRRVARDLSRPGLGREKVLATLVRLLDATGVRVGNPEYARENESYGLTTLRDSHALIESGRIRFRFRGKSGKKTTVEVADRRLARIVKACRDIPGQELFQYLDNEGESRIVGSGDVNDYLREIAGQDFTAKEFRTWSGTVCATGALLEIGVASSETEAKRNVVRAIEVVAEELSNTVAVARRCYVHPEVLEAYHRGPLAPSSVAPVRGLRQDEALVLNILRSGRKQRKTAA